MVLNSLGTGVRVPSFLRGCSGEADPMLVKVKSIPGKPHLGKGSGCRLSKVAVALV